MVGKLIDEEDIFRIAVEINSHETRDEYVRQVCGDDEPLLQRVLVLLRAHDESSRFLESPPPGIAATAVAAPAVEKPGTQIGPYKLLQQVGEGGMGVIYVAEQTEPVRRRVALKIIKPGMDTKQVIARFEAERQALAMMDHPHIAKVLDAGATEAGRPYFVMELVRGMPFTDYCDKARLSPRQRLELFVDVCHAIQHAHQKGIIHRDLKPSNILITLHDGKPVVKVIDFGVAKAIGQQLTERTVYTALTQLVGTPLYMSPEQAELSGLDIDTRSDVYSLGVLLYELLTGQTPFDKDRLKSVSFDEMRRMIREDEPPRPSRRFSTLGAAALFTASQHRGVDERRLSRILSGELDWIVMKALEKDRSRRYESASALAADIQRYLSDEPVLACPPTTMYRFQKFSRKHKASLTTAAAIAVCLILGTTVSAWQAARATTAEAQAVANEQKAYANEQKASANAAQAETKAKEAIEQRDEAQRQRDEVKALADKLAAKEQQLQRTLFAAHMNLAHNAWAMSSVGRVVGLLEQYRPKEAEADLRGFEWHYLHRLCHADLLTLKGHASGTSGVHNVAFSPDGKHIASGGGLGQLKVWDAQTGQVVHELKGHNKAVRSVAFSPDGNRLASFSDDALKVWDARTGQQLLTLNDNATGYSNNVVFSPDGKQLATGGAAVKVWDLETGLQLRILSHGRGRNFDNGVAYSPDGKRLASGSKVWDSQTGEELLTLKRGGSSVAVNVDGSRKLTIDEMVIVASSGSSIVFSPDGKRLASANRTWGTGRGDVRVWDAQNGEELLVIKGADREGISGLAFSPDGKRLAGGSWDESIRIWDPQTGELLGTLKGHTGGIDVVAFSPDGTRLASASRDSTVKVWQVQPLVSPESATFRGGEDRVWGLAFSPDGKRLASSARTGNAVKVWDAHTGQDLLSIKEPVDRPAGQIWSVAFSSDGKRLASAAADRGVKIWNAETGAELVSLMAPKENWFEPLGVALSPGGERVAVVDSDNEVSVWDAQTGQRVLTLKGLPENTSGNVWMTKVVAFSPDGKLLASAAMGQAKVWDVRTGEERLTLKGPHAIIMGVAFSPDGKRLATSHKGEIKLWDVETGEEILTLRGHTNLIPAVAFSPDGRRLASCSHDGTVKIWGGLKSQSQFRAEVSL